MTALLEDKVYALVLDRPLQTSEQIAMSLRARRATVEGILKHTGMFDWENGAGRARLWKIACGNTGRPRTPHRKSQGQRMADLLADGQWHSDAELWEIGVGRPNSRAAELRKRGLLIEHRKDSRQVLPSRAHQYRLVGVLDEGTVPQPVPSSSVPGRADGLLRARPTSEQTAGDAQQLSMTGPAFRRQERAA